MQNNLIEKIKVLNNEIKIKPADKGDASAFINLMNKQYLRKKKASYFYWMFFENHLPTKLYAAYDKDTPVAFYGVQIHPLSIGVVCSLSVDIITDENYRNRGLFKLLENEAFRFADSHNAVAMTVLPNLSGMEAHCRMKTWKNISKIDTLIFDCKKRFSVQTNLKDEIRRENLVSFSKDKEYRRWRFDQNPVYDYIKINFSDKIFAVTKIFEDKQNKIRYGDIVDYECDLYDVFIWEELFSKTYEHLISENVEFITCWALPHTIPYLVLTSMGFRDLPQERYFCVRVLNPGFDFLYDFRNWFLTQADAEIY